MTAGLVADAGRVVDVEDRLAVRAEPDTLMVAGQEGAGPEAVVEGLVAGIAGAARYQDDEGRQVAVRAAQAVSHPGAEAGPACNLRSGLTKGHGRVVIDGLRGHRLDQAQLIDHPAGVW